MAEAERLERISAFLETTDRFKPHLVVLVRAGAHVERGRLVERADLAA